jgi:hypothetical protein
MRKSNQNIGNRCKKDIERFGLILAVRLYEQLQAEYSDESKDHRRYYE